MKQRLCILLICVGTSTRAEDSITIVIPESAGSVVQTAAADLQAGLEQAYSDITVAGAENPSGKSIFLYTNGAAPEELINRPGQPEGFVVSTMGDNAYIVGSDPAGLVYGVHQLLEKLGHGFYLNRHVVPPPKKQVSFEGWELKNHPLVKYRVAFNWHNFLSGCTGWNEEDWNQWTENTQKMGYNMIMVHAYGNNPMFQFSSNGVKKPVGLLNTSRHSYEWGTQSIDDIRRTVGGELYEGPVFGADAGKVPADQRIPAVQDMMRRAFQHAEKRGVKVAFCFDIATPQANPEAILRTMQPETVLFDGYVNPETEEGYSYYKEQVRTLLELYPQIDVVVAWTRIHAGENCRAPMKAWPKPWQEQYAALLSANPGLDTMKYSERMFLYSKMVLAYRRALDELGHKDMPMMVGSWRFQWMPEANLILPEDIGFIGLDTCAHSIPEQQTPEGQEMLRIVAQKRDCIPIAWSHHDDGEYVGRSYTPAENYYSILNGCSGFGVLHWMMRPFDLYFRSLIEQTWANTRDRPLDATIDDYADKVFGSKAAAPMSAFFKDWIRHAPIMGRETTSRLFTRTLTIEEADPETCLRRLEMLESVPTDDMTPDAVSLLDYYHEMEHFLIGIIREQLALQEMTALLESRKLDEIKPLLAQSRPENVIRQYAKAIQCGGPDRGELGFLYQLNADWLPYFVALREAALTRTTRVNFMETMDDPLAQKPGGFTWYIDAEGNYWRGYGSRTLEGSVFVLAEDPEAHAALPATVIDVCRTGITKETKISFAMRPLTGTAFIPGTSGKAKTFPAGDYQVRFFFVEHEVSSGGERLFDLTVKPVPARGSGTADAAEPSQRAPALGTTERIDIFAEAGRNAILERVIPVTLGENGYVAVELTPVHGSASICGAVLEPR